MVVLVPIAFLVPAALMFTPPLMPLTPATLPRIVQLTTLVICPYAMASVFLDCLVSSCSAWATRRWHRSRVSAWRRDTAVQRTAPRMI